MRILNVTETYAPFYEFGGPPVKVHALARGLAARGHEVGVLSADWGFEKRIPEQGSAERAPFGWRWEESGVNAVYLPTWLRYRSVSWNPAAGRFCRAKLAEFDVAHIFGLYDLLGPAVAKMCRKLGVPYVVEPIGMFVPIVRNVRMKRIYHQIFGKEMLNGAAAIVATAEQEVRELVSGGVDEKKIVIRRNGVEIPKTFPERGAFRNAKGIPEDAIVVLYLGRLSEKKDPMLLLETFANLPPSYQRKEARLVFAGPDEGGMLERLQLRARELGVDGRVQFTGVVFGEEKWAAYRDADIFVLVSRNENFGNTAAEAAAAGTAVIVSEECGIAPLLANGAVVIPHERNALRNALLNLLTQEPERRKLAEAGQRAAERLGWDEPLRQQEAIYGNACMTASRGGKSAG